MPDPVAAWLEGLDAQPRAMIDALREIAAMNPSLTERIKWNAPSFAIGDEDRVTLGVERKGGVRLVLHRGVKPKDAAGFAFADPDRLAQWPAPDRGVIRFSDLAEIEAKRGALTDLCRRWIAATG
jgi:hypothetical protein